MKYTSNTIMKSITILAFRHIASNEVISLTPPFKGENIKIQKISFMYLLKRSSATTGCCPSWFILKIEAATYVSEHARWCTNRSS